MNTRLTMSAREASKVLGISYVNTLQLCHAEGFPAVWIGRKVVIPRAALERWLAQRHGGEGSLLDAAGGRK